MISNVLQRNTHLIPQWLIRGKMSFHVTFNTLHVNCTQCYTCSKVTTIVDVQKEYIIAHWTMDP